jgi:hypothetical protein
MTSGQRTASTWHGRDLPLFIVAFFFVYATAFRAIPEGLFTARILGVGGILLLFIAALWRRRVAVDPGIACVLLLFGAYTGWVAVRTSMTGGQDMSLLSNALLLFVQVFPGAMLLAVWMVRREYEFHHVVLLLHAIIVTQAVFIVVTFLSWEFRLLTLDLLHDVESNVDALHPFRVRGLTHSTGAKLSAFQAVGLFLTSYLLQARRGLLRQLYLTASVPLLLLSILLTGRVGFLAIVLVAMMVLLSGLQAGAISRRLVGGVVLASLAMVLAAFSFESVYLATGGRQMPWGEDVLAGVLRWVTDEFSLYYRERTLVTGTAGVLLREHWFWPDSAALFLFGDPRTWAVARIHSDVGLIRVLFGTGLIGAILLYAGAGGMLVATLRNLRVSADRWLVAGLFGWLFVLELKEPFVLDVRYSSMLALLLFFAALRRRSARDDEGVDARGGNRELAATTPTGEAA